VLSFTVNKEARLKVVYSFLIKKAISELWSVTCHMGSHSVTCHTIQVNMPLAHLNPSQTNQYPIELWGRTKR